MNTKLITQTFIGPVNIPYRRRREKFARHKVQRRTNIPRRTNRKGYYTQTVRRWFVRSTDKGGQSFNGEITMEQSTNWESLIAQRMRPCVALKIEDAVKRNRDIYEKSPRRKAMHKAWEHSPEGKASRRESYRRYAQSEHGKEVKRRNKRASYLRHNDNPQWHEHKLQLQREWRERKKAEKQNENEAA